MRRASITIGTLVMLVAVVLSSSVVSAESIVLPAGGVKVFGATLSEGYTWQFSCDATDPVNVMVMSRDNYEIYESGGTPYVYSEYTSRSVTSTSFTISGLSEEVCIVIESTNLLMDTTVSYTEEVIVPSDGGGDGDGSGTPGFDMPIIIVASVVSIGLFMVIKRRR